VQGEQQRLLWSLVSAEAGWESVVTDPKSGDWSGKVYNHDIAAKVVFGDVLLLVILFSSNRCDH
jgi:hypothetical protein